MIKRLLLLLLFLVLSLMVLFQIPYVQQKTIVFVQRQIAETTGWEIKVESLEGILPFSGTLSHLSMINNQGELFSVERISFFLSPWRLLKGQIAFRHLTVKGIVLPERTSPAPPTLPLLPFSVKYLEWEVSPSLTLLGSIDLEDQLLHFQFQLEGLGFPLSGELLTYNFQKGSWHLDSWMESRGSFHKEKGSYRLHGWIEEAPFEGTFSLQEQKGALEGALPFAEKFALEASMDYFLFEAWGLALSNHVKLEVERRTNEISVRGDVDHFHFQDVELDHVHGETLLKEGEFYHPYEMHVSSGWLKETALRIKGLFGMQEGQFEVYISDLDGSLFTHTFSLADPVGLLVSQEKLILTPLLLQVGKGNIEAFAELHPKQWEGEINIHSLPLAFLDHFFGEEWGIEGEAEGQVELSGSLAHPFAQAHLHLDSLKFHNPALMHMDPFYMEATTTWTPERARAHLSLEQNAHQLLLLEGEKKEELLDFTLQGEGEVASFVEFFFEKSTSLSGALLLDLHLTGTLQAPLLEGEIALKNGAYESLDSGALLRDIQAHLDGKGKLVVTAHDTEGGTLDATGTLHLTSFDFPYDVEVHTSHLHFIRLDYANASTDGSLHLVGDRHQGTVEGSLTVHQALLSIPEHVPATMKSLEVTFLNGEGPLAPPLRLIKEGADYPLHFNFTLQAPGHVFVEGRNLRSEWEGNMTFTGTPQHPLINGSLNLKSGRYEFNGKNFEGISGAVTFNGDPTLKTALYIVAEQQIDNMRVQIILKGPIHDPKLAFRSNPPLPEQDILSWILFNRASKEITPLQGAALSQSLFTLSGGKDRSNLLGRLREQIGIDRLDIKNIETDGDNEVSVSVGKYISDGVLISVSKSITAEANQVSLEAHLTPHIKLQGEVGDNAEGRLHLKWENDY